MSQYIPLSSDSCNDSAHNETAQPRFEQYVPDI